MTSTYVRDLTASLASTYRAEMATFVAGLDRHSRMRARWRAEADAEEEARQERQCIAADEARKREAGGQLALPL
jgi:hypothetical protein